MADFIGPLLLGASFVWAGVMAIRGRRRYKEDLRASEDWPTFEARVLSARGLRGGGGFDCLVEADFGGGPERRDLHAAEVEPRGTVLVALRPDESLMLLDRRERRRNLGLTLVFGWPLVIFGAVLIAGAVASLFVDDDETAQPGATVDTEAFDDEDGRAFAAAFVEETLPLVDQAETLLLAAMLAENNFDVATVIDGSSQAADAFRDAAVAIAALPGADSAFGDHMKRVLNQCASASRQLRDLASSVPVDQLSVFMREVQACPFALDDARTIATSLA